MSASRCSIAVLLGLLCTCTALADAGSGPTEQQPVLTLEELLHRLDAENEAGVSAAVDQAVRLGPDYAWLLARLLQVSDSVALADRICKGLARNGDAESLSALRETVADTSRSSVIRDRAVSALALARDHEAIPLLSEVASRCADQFLAGAAREAIARIESPGSYRPLIEIENGILRFGFLLDDLASVDYTEWSGVSHSFAPGEFRRICDLLQSGTVVPPSDISPSAVLTFRLKDGSDVDVRTDGMTYGNISGHMMRSPALGEFIMSRIGRGDGGGEQSD